MGCCATPLTTAGASTPAASSTVGIRSETNANWSRSPPRSLMRLGQLITSGLRMPPRCEAICFIHGNGVFRAHAQPAL